MPIWHTHRRHCGRDQDAALGVEVNFNGGVAAAVQDLARVQARNLRLAGVDLGNEVLDTARSDI